MIADSWRQLLEMTVSDREGESCMMQEIEFQKARQRIQAVVALQFSEHTVAAPYLAR